MSVVKTELKLRVPLWARTGAFSLLAHRVINILLLWAAVVLARYSEDRLLIKLFTDGWFTGLPTQCLNKTGFPEGVGCFSKRGLSAALIGSAEHITGLLGSLEENFPCECTRGSVAAQPVLILWMTEKQHKQLRCCYTCIDALPDNTNFFIGTSGNPSRGFLICCNAVFWKHTMAMAVSGCRRSVFHGLVFLNNVHLFSYLLATLEQSLRDTSTYSRANVSYLLGWEGLCQ